MDFKKLIETNHKLKTTDIKGKNYVEVNERIKAFWELFPNGRLNSEIVSIDNGVCIIRAYAFEDKDDDNPISIGTAYEKENSTFINKTSYIENCETSAYGRCLGILGIGIDTSVASAEEVANAMQQQDENKLISKNMIDGLNMAIKNAKLNDEIVEQVLSKYDYSSTNEIRVKDYMKIANELKSKK